MYALDIDSTIAIDRDGCARYLNEQLHLGIAEETLRDINAYWQFTELAQVVAYRRDHEEHYQEALKASDHAPCVIAAMVPLPGAVQAVNLLAQEASVVYVTCRREEEADLTRSWLKQHSFPASDAVYPCEHYHWKYIHAFHAAPGDEPIILIDDMMERVIKSFGIMAREHAQIAYQLLKRIEVVGLGYTTAPTLPAHMPFAFSLLPSWQADHVASWLGRGQKEKEPA